MKAIALAGLVLALGGQALDRSAAADRMVAALAREPTVAAALAALKADEPRTIESQVRLAEIAAPSFKEAARGEAMRGLFRQAGLQNVRVDKAGNVLAERRGVSLHPHVVVAAHLDTVFPEGLDVRVRRDGAILRGLGVGDDSRGLAVLAALARALTAAAIPLDGTVTFVADVGEEGLGNLRGVRELFDVTLKNTVDYFVTVDGTGLAVAHTFVGSHRYRVTFTGPGGHSFGAFGTVNPIDALSRAVTRISSIPVPSEPATTFNVGRIGGGTAVNAIPNEAWMEVDLRSAGARPLAALDASFKKAVADAVADVNRSRRGADQVLVKIENVGERPLAAEPPDALVVQVAVAATRAIGGTPVDAVSSSDANYPASRGVPSVEIGGGGHGSDAHAVTESFDTADSWMGTQRALLVTVALARK